MEHLIEKEFECQICLELFVEPVTTLCGHTFCRICLIKFLNTKLNCPICRKPILQNIESLAKNVILENLIKTTHKLKYEERMKSVKIFNEQVGATNFRNNIPIIFLKDSYVWPKLKKSINVSDFRFESTISISSVNDRFLVITQNDFLNEDVTEKIACVVEIISINKRQTEINIEVIGLKRILLKEIKIGSIDQNNTTVYLCSGEIFSDLELESPGLVDEVKEKLIKITKLNEEFLLNAPYSVVQKLEKLYGKAPSVSGVLKFENLESMSFFYLNLIKSDEKSKFYNSKNIIERVNWILSKFEEGVNHSQNRSLAIVFYDLNPDNSSIPSIKYSLLLLIIFLLIILGFKYRIIKI